MRRALAPLVVLSAIPLGVVAYRIQVHALPSPTDHAVAIVAVAWAFVAAGAIAWWCRSRNHLGLLLMAAGMFLLLRQFRYSNDALVVKPAYSVFRHWALALEGCRQKGTMATICDLR